MAGKELYTDFWEAIIKEVTRHLRRGENEFSVSVAGLKDIGGRSPSNPYSYRGSLNYKYALPLKFTDSAPVRDLKEVIRKYSPIRPFLVNEVHMTIDAGEHLRVQVRKVSLQEVVNEYKAKVRAEGLEEERYKWEEIGADHWDLRAADFMAMVKGIKFHNLVYQNAKSVLYNDLAGKFADQSRLLFHELFDDAIDLQARITRFQQETTRLYRTIYDKFNPHQDERTIASYLTYYDPNRYTLYKDSFYTKFCRIQGIKPEEPGKKYVHYLKLLRPFIGEYIAADQELLDLVEHAKGAHGFADPAHLLLAQDILFTVLDGGKETEEVEQETIAREAEPFNEKNTQEMNLNTILYGPPGTGKTYHSIDKALVALGEDLTGKSRAAIKAIFDQKVEERQIVFTTFHQSLSYEDFIEGIKPQEPDPETGLVSYAIEDGIFKSLCLAAGSPQGLKTQQSDVFDKARFYKMSLGGKVNPDIHDWCIRHNCVALGWGEDKNYALFKSSLTSWITYRNKFNEEYPDVVQNSRFNVTAMFTFQNMKVGDIVVISKGNHIVDAIGKITGDYYWDDSAPFPYYQFRKVEWLATNLNISPSVLFSIGITQQSIYEFTDRDIKKEAFIALFKDEPKGTKPYVLIIDEINRGNVSQIFGELITLIEEDKRSGNSEAITAILPYSKTSFSVPANLFIIGTMNTADRSIETLDTALRRRFVFEKMLPDAALLEPYACFTRFGGAYAAISRADWKRFHGAKASYFYRFYGVSDLEIGGKQDLSYYDMMEAVQFDPEKGVDALKAAGLVLRPVVDMAVLLTVMNKRIALLKDQDHLIGHSFFMRVESLADLMAVFEHKLVPLLQEFFFNDYGKLQLILGRGFIADNGAEVQFATDDGDEYGDGSMYSIHDDVFANEKKFLDAIGGMRL